ncbi:cardiolipin synthase [Gorillibacterium timonense]|uniref:cardiolipin synthase n=1 Tax=Gorillibacterium timonense TaxID=1689269 RepID=UPI00071CA1C4|nr:cardiolipin synthase [Gorillibacterium timonense]
MNLTAFFLGFILVLNMLFALVVIFQERKDAGSTWAWLLVLYFIPILGFVLYALFAQNFRRVPLFHWDSRQKLMLEEAVVAQLDEIRTGDYRFHNPSSFHNRDLIYMFLNNNHAILSETNKIDLFTDGHDKFDQLFKDINNATEYIHVQYYIFQKDWLGEKLIDLLTQKAREGVCVRVLYDELGSRRLNKAFFREFREAGGQAQAFFPSKLRLINTRLNYRNHRKLVILDGRIGYVGGFNVGEEYLGLDPKFGYWRDTHLRIQGPSVFFMHCRFMLDWNQAAPSRTFNFFPQLLPGQLEQGSAGVQIVTSGPDSVWEVIKDGYIKMISSAKRSIYIQTPYFIPDASMMDALRIAALSGLDVTLMIPDKPDHPFVHWATLSYVGEMLKAGARVYLYENGFIHAKTLVVDEEVASVGTANIDVRSFRLNFEVNAFVYDEELSKKLIRSFQEDIEMSRLLTLDQYIHRPKWVKIKESVSRLLSPIL